MFLLEFGIGNFSFRAFYLTVLKMYPFLHFPLDSKIGHNVQVTSAVQRFKTNIGNF